MNDPVRVAFAPADVGGNPYLRNLAASLEAAGVEVVGTAWPPQRLRAGEVDVVHLHWVHLVAGAFGGGPRGQAARYLAGLAGLRGRARLVWTMHNLASHEAAAPRLDRLMHRATAAASAGIVVHCAAAAAAARRLWPAAPRPLALAHPGESRAAADRAAARRALGLGDAERLVVLPGRVRDYKDTAEAAALALAEADAGVHVVVAGAPDSAAQRDRLRALAAADARLRLHLRDLAEDELDTLLAAADVALLPYRRVLTSGAAVRCLESGVPVVAPALGCLPEQVAGAGWLYAPGDLAGGVRAALHASDERLAAWRQQARPLATRMTWDAFGRAHADLYRRVARA